MSTHAETTTAARVVLGPERWAWLLDVAPSPVMALSVVANTPWSSVVRVRTAAQDLYLKHAPSSLFIEATVLDRLETVGAVNVPRVLAASPALGCFLMPSVGDVTLREGFAGHPDVDQLLQALTLYRTFQRQTQPFTAVFLDAGVPDHRLDRLPDHVERLLAHNAWLTRDGATVEEQRRWRRLIPAVRATARSLAELGFEEGLNQSDFHDNNVVVQRGTGRLNLLDLGETVVEHPLFALRSFVDRTCGRYGWGVDSEMAQRLNQAVRDGWDRPEGDVLHAQGLVARLQPLVAVLAHRRLLDAAGEDALNGIDRMRHRARDGLRDMERRLSGARTGG